MSYDLSRLDAVYGRPKVVELIKAHRAEHHCSIEKAIDDLTEQIQSDAGHITDGQIRVAIAVLRAYAKGDLDIEPALLVDLDAAIDDAAGTTICEIEAPPDYMRLLA